MAETGRGCKIWPLLTMWSSTSLSLSFPTILASLLFFNYTRQAPSSVSLHLLITSHQDIQGFLPNTSLCTIQWNITNEPWKHYAKWRKPVKKITSSFCPSNMASSWLWLFSLPKRSSLLSSQQISSCHPDFSLKVFPSEAFPFTQSEVATQPLASSPC